jgi:hypothetical protein
VKPKLFNRDEWDEWDKTPNKIEFFVLKPKLMYGFSHLRLMFLHLLSKKAIRPSKTKFTGWTGWTG